MKHSLDKRRRPKRRPVAFETLEPRLLLSADLAPALAPLAHDALPPIPAEHRSLAAMAELPRVVMAQEAARSSELVFVDASLPDYERLVADVLRATGGKRPVEVILLDPSRDGVAQMTEALASRTGLAAVHIITHGGDGQLQLGDATLDAAALEANSDAIAAWSRAFAADGDLLLYGCNVAETARGDAFIHALALLTGADIAASDDLTGTARLGGDWDLERTTGLIETPIAFSSDLGSWAGVLAQLDWDDPAIDWPATGLGPTSFAAGGGNVTITVSDPAGRLNNSSPDDDTMADQGGLPVTEQGLYVSSTGFLPGESAVITIDFSHLGGVSNVSFTIFDLDRGGGPNFIDEVQASYTASGAVTLAIATSPNNTLIAPDTVQGTQATTSNGPNSADANATLTFTGTGITQIRLDYRNAGGATNQSITLHDINFTPNAPPSGTNGAVAVNEDATYAFAAANFGFSDPDAGDTLSAVRIDSLPVAGTFVLVGSGAVTTGQVITVADINAGNLRFTPAANVNGAAYASFTFSVRDSAGLFDVAPNTLTINVTPVNDAPAAANDGYAVNEDVTLNVAAAGVLANDSDIDGPALSAALVAGPSNGSLTLNANGSFSYTPNANFNGTDSFTYRASDGSLLSNIATVTITVNAVNDPPSAVANAYVIAEDGTLNVPAAGVLANDSDVEGPVLSAVLVGGPSNAAAFTLNANGSFSYTPTANFNGTDSFTYRASDGSLQSAVVTVTLTVTAVNDAPVGSGSATLGAVAEEAASPAGATVAALLGGNYSDAADGAGATGLAGVAIVGNAATAAQGVWQYSPDGLAWTTIGVALSDASAVTLPATERIRFLPAANFNGTPGALSVRLADGSAGAIAAATGVNLGGAVGGTGNWSAATVALGTSITAVNDAPTFAALANQTLAEDAGAQTLAGFTTVAPGGGADEAGQTFGYAVTNDNNALFAVQPTIAANGTLTYTVAPNAIGTATVTVFVTDSGGTANGGVDTTGPRTFTITATPVADAPSVTNAATLEDTQTTSGLVITRNAADGAEVTHYKITGIAGGTLFLNDGVTAVANGTFITAAEGAAGLKFTPAANSVANGSFDIQASTAANNARLGGSVVTATIAVTPVNDAPTFAALANQTLAEDAGAQTVAGFTTVAPGGGADEAGQTFGYAVTNDNNALFAVQPTIAANGTLTYTTAANVSSTATVTVFVTDSGGTANGGVDTTGPRTFTITATPVADTPSVTNAATLEDTQTTSGLVITRNAADGAEVTHYKITGIAGGTLFLNDGVTAVANGTFITAAQGAAGLKFTPTANAVANGSFDIQASTAANNAGLGGSVVTATITVTAVNDEPSVALAGNQTVAEDAGAQTLAGFTTVAPGGGADEAAQTFGYTVTNDNNALFAVQPTIAANGTLTYTSAPNANGVATITVTLSDSGGVANSGDDTAPAQTFTLTVTAVNDAPVGSGSATLGAVAEEAASPAGATVAALLGGNYSDAADGAGATGLAGVAIVGNAATAAQGVWQYSPDGLAWTTIGVALSDASAVTLPATERIRFLPAANFNGTPGALSVRLADGSAGAIAAATGVNLGGAVGGTGNWSAATVALGTSITAVNDAPTFAALANQTLAEDAGAQTLAGFTTVAPGGGADEAGQTFGYAVTNDNNALFAVQPTIAANGTLTYTVAPNAIGTATVTVFVTDSGGTANGGVDTTGPRTFTITATPVADAPTLTVNAAAGNEDTAIALSIAPALVDTDGSESLALTVSAIPIGATLSDGVNTFTASAGNQSVAITTWNLAQLRITAPLHSDVDFTLAVAATATETANGATATTNANLAVTVNAVADTPTLTVNAASGNEDSAIPLSAAAALVDVDGSETLAIAVASIPVGATLSDGTNSFTATAGNQSVAVTGWNLALVRVTPPLNADTDFTLTVSATATEALGGSAASASANLAVDVVPVNDAPTLVAPAAIAVTEDVASALTGISFADIDAGASPVTATFTVPQGALAATSSGGVVVGGTATALTLTGTVADVNAFVAGGGLTYTTALDAVTPVTLGVSVDDLGNTGLGGPLASAPTNVTLNVSAVNDAPVNTVPAGATVTEDAAGSITGLSVADVDAGAGNVQVTLAAPAGTFAATAGGGVAVAGSGTGTITLTGTTAAITAFVGASNLTYTTALDATAPVAVTMTTSDLGNSGAGGTLLDTDTFTVNVNAVNDAPTIAAPPVIAVIEDVASPITGIVIDDVDGTAGPVSVTLSVPSGTLAATSGAGVVVAGSGTGALALVGTTTAINAFLAAGSVTFTTALDATAPVPLSAFVNDLGNFGAGGPLSSPTIGVTLNVTAVNDAPVLGPVALSIDPLQTVTMAGGNMSATDVDNPAASIVFLVAGVTNGQFELAAAPGVPVTSFTQAQLASGAVRFAHTNAGFGPSFSIFVSDGAAVAGPGVAVVSFRAPGTDSPPEEKRRDPTLSDVPFASGTVATSGAGLGDPTATAFLRTSFGGGEAAPAVSFAEAAQEVQVVLARPVRAAALLDLRAGVAPSDGFVEAERIPTNLPKMDFAINAVRHDEALRSFDVALDSARITGMALSVGAVWWAARAGGLLASLLASTPAWRHVDPLPVLGGDEDEPEIEWNNEADTVREDERSEAEVFDEARAAANRTR